MKEVYYNAMEWLQDAADEGIVQVHELMLIIKENVELTVIEDHFTGDLEGVGYYETYVEVTWHCQDVDHESLRPHPVYDRYHNTTEALSKVEAGQVEAECPVCGAELTYITHRGLK